MSVRFFVRFRSLMRAAPVVLALTSLATFSLAAQAQVGSVAGTIADSLRGAPLSAGFVELLPTGRQTATAADGSFRFDSVRTGDGYRLRVMHARLDTLGIGLLSEAFGVSAGDTQFVDVGLPSARTIIAMLCPAALIERGGGALVGFVRDPDTGRPIDSAEVELVYDESPLRQVRMPVTRVAQAAANGQYVICGLPETMAGRIVVSRRGVRSGEIAVATTDSTPLALRGLGMSHSTVARAAAESLTVLSGDAVVRGRVLSSRGSPIANARVQMDGTESVALTDSAGEFTLERVPTGTHRISARKIGHDMAEIAVDVSRYDTPPVLLRMDDFVPLEAVATVSQREKDMETTGFARRKARGLGFFLEGEQIDHGPTSLGESLRLVPGIRVGYDAANAREQKALIMTSRDPRGCLRFVVDGVFWQEVGGDIEKFVRPDDLEALEMYTPATVPGEFAAASRGKCSVLVLWTRHKIRRVAK